MKPRITKLAIHDRSKEALTYPTRRRLYFLPDLYTLEESYLILLSAVYPMPYTSFTPSINPSIHPPIHSSQSINQSIHPSIHHNLSIHPSQPNPHRLEVEEEEEEEEEESESEVRK